MVIPDSSAVPAAMSSLRLSGAEARHILEALEASHACTVDGITTLDNVMAGGFRASSHPTMAICCTNIFNIYHCKYPSSPGETINVIDRGIQLAFFTE